MTLIDRSTGLARQIAEILQDEIMQGKLTVETRLPAEAELAERFRVSQPTVREAMKILAAKKLIRSKRGPKGGVFVNSPTLEAAAQSVHEATGWLVSLGVFELTDIIESRRKLGRVGIELACERADPEDCTRIEEALQNVANAGISDEDFCRLEVAFHQAIAQAGQNAVICFALMIANNSMIPATNMISFRYRERDKVIALHHQIFAAIKAGDGPAAVTAFDQLIDYQSAVYDRAIAARATAGSTRAGQ